MPEYIAFHPGATDEMVLAATPRRMTEAEVAADVQRAWHNPGGDKRAQQLVPYRIDGQTVRPMKIEVHRRTEVRA